MTTIQGASPENAVSAAFGTVDVTDLEPVQGLRPSRVDFPSSQSGSRSHGFEDPRAA
jgi:hypothetical protein